MLNLDFSINTSKERKKFIDNYIAERTANGYTFPQKEVETMANYVLYGKDEDGTSIVDRKEIEIATRYSSYKKKRPESLEELMESPTFNENHIVKTNIFKKEKPKIDREKDKDIPGIQELWKSIDRLDHQIRVTEGKETDPKIKPLTPQQLYKAKHHLIDLRKSQYILKDTVKPTVPPLNPIEKLETIVDSSIYWDSQSDYSIAPLGLYSSKPARFKTPREIQEKDYHYNSSAKYILDYRNPDHIYELVEYYSELSAAALNNPESLLGDIIETLDFYIEFADLDDEKTLILEDKIQKKPVIQIQKDLKEKLNIEHSPNYISTIYTQKVCGAIAEATKLHYDMYMNREYPSMWKKCNQCGEVKFLDSRVFMRKSRSSDGYNSKCKKCCKENRQKK